MAHDLRSGRTKQKLRTRLALLRAVRDLLDEGRKPTLEEAAELAMVSRATAYRYFPSIEDLVAEATMEEDIADVETVMGNRTDLLDRVLAAVSGVTDTLLGNEVAMHIMAKTSADRWLQERSTDASERPARRLIYIDAALEPHAQRLGPEVTERLRSGLALVCGMEAVISARDVAGLDPADARAAFAWAAGALVAAAEREAESQAARPPSRPTRTRTPTRTNGK